MSILKVLNVGQGDSLIINPQSGCVFYNEQIIVDLGDGSYNITKDIDMSKNLTIVLTHHDKDHIGGFKYFIGKKFDCIKTIVLPAYQNEITLIAKSILSLKGINNAEDCSDLIDNLNDIINNQIFLKEISNMKRPNIVFAYENYSFCDHMKVLNPPVTFKSRNWTKGLSDEIFEFYSDKLFNSEFSRDINIYFSTVRNTERNMDYWYIDSRNLNEIFIYNNQQNHEPIENSNNLRQKANFYFQFTFENIEQLIAFNNNPTRKNFSTIYNSFIKCAHDASIVLKADFANQTFLLTGDASKKVFNRLIDNHICIQAKYLKIPHHGSKNNLDQKILNAINPEYAIISHNNRRFGKSKDTHPHKEILELLEKNRVEILVTNDVVKDDITIIAKYDNKKDNNVEVC